MSFDEAQNLLDQVPDGWEVSELCQLAAKVKRVVILKTSWYKEINEGLLRSATRYLMQWGVNGEYIEEHTVSGAMELPLAAKLNILKQPTDFVIALGCVVRGQTPHFDYVCSAAIEGLMQVQLETLCPIGFGVLTVNKKEEAEKRIDKGAEAAKAAFLQFARTLELKGTQIMKGKKIDLST